MKSQNKITKSEYKLFHSRLVNGIFESEILEEMISKAYSIALEIDRLSRIRHYPNNGKRCDDCCKKYCAITFEDEFDYWMEFFDDENDGYFICSWCGKNESWWDYLESRNWMYSDAHETILKRANEMFKGNINNRWLAFERLLQIIHMSGTIAEWFIEDGTQTIDEFRGVTN